MFKDSKDLQTLLSQVPRDPPPSENIKKPGHHDELLYIYTSGTTGLPKAAVITHSRYIYIAAAIHRVADFWDEDVFYSPLPLYHTACGKCIPSYSFVIYDSFKTLTLDLNKSNSFFSRLHGSWSNDDFRINRCNSQEILSFCFLLGLR